MANKPDKRLIGAFRDFASTGYLEQGLDHLRRYHAPKIRKGTADEMMHDAINAQGYMAALEDVITVLTTFEKKYEEEVDSLDLKQDR